jgi:hypothetical protein
MFVAATNASVERQAQGLKYTRSTLASALVTQRFRRRRVYL